MSESYVYVEGEPPKTREDLNSYIEASERIVTNLELQIYKRERKRQAVANLLTKNPDRKFFSELDIKKEIAFLETNEIDYDWTQDDQS